MFQIRSKAGNSGCGARANVRVRAWISVPAAIVLLAGLIGGSGALSQQSQEETKNALDRSKDIVAHLNSVIQFYRASTQPIQKAGEPNDVVYRDQAAALSAQVATFAFQSAKAEAEVRGGTVDAGSGDTGEQQRMQTMNASAEKQISDLQARQADLNKQLETAKPSAVAGLQAEKKQVQGALDLANAMKDALQKVISMSDTQGGTGLAADIDRLQRSVPELQSSNKTAAPQLLTLETARSSGVSSQGMVLLDLFETKHQLDILLKDNDDLHRQALDLRTPLSKVLRGLIQEGQELSQQAVNAPAAPSSGVAPAGASAPQNIGAITKQFKALSAATVPLSQEIIVLEESRSNLAAWRTSVSREYDSIFHALLLRILVILIALGLIFAGGEVWSRATNKYVRDIRRRRQLLIIRRAVIGFLSAIVVLFGFVTQFNSLATFAGFITAGIAVGLQTILLSVAAYFFIIGRYGVKVGDRITISSVTGDVIDVGLVRFYMMELAGSGTELQSTGRVAMFSNAVLFQAGTPLYKQMPGTEYAWHELIVKLNESANYAMVCEAITKEIQKVYDGYREVIERQHMTVQNWMQASIDAPGVQTRMQFNGGAFQLWARFPVQIRQASEADEKLTQALFELMAKNPEIKSAVASTPVIQASVRG